MWRRYSLNNLPRQRWQTMCANSLLNSADWLTIWSVMGYSPEFFLSEAKTDCGIAVLATGRGLLRRRQSQIDGLPATVLQGASAVNGSKVQHNQHDQHDALVALAGAGGFRSVFVDYHNSVHSDELPAGWRSYSTNTQRIDLGSEGGFSSEARRHISSSKERGATVRMVQSESDVIAFYRLLTETNQRLGRTRVYPLALYQRIFQLMQSEARIVWLICESAGVVIGSHLALVENTELISWAPVMDRGESDKKPAYALLDSLVSIARERNLQTVNLGGSPAEAEGLRRFKSRFGAQDYLYRTLVYQPGWARAFGIGGLS